MLRDGLLLERSYFGPIPFNTKDEELWTEAVNKYEKLVAMINTKINKYNLVVPILHKQMAHVSLEKQAKKALMQSEYCREEGPGRETLKREKDKDHSTQQQTFFDVFYSLFKS